MSAHTHEWDIYNDFDDRIRARCDCGEDKDVYDVLGAQEQRLAEVEAQITEIKTLLQDALPGGESDYLVWAEKVRAFLAK
jgi:hypothetical protein